MCDRNGYRLWVPPFPLQYSRFGNDIVYPLKKVTASQKPFILPTIDSGNASVRESGCV
jgi:hypothetical protein